MVKETQQKLKISRSTRAVSIESFSLDSNESYIK
jgi:hypothetical protein